jgi:peptidoglycan/xylan/chitin deacetylase (PgdA/CDA1 family)
MNDLSATAMETAQRPVVVIKADDLRYYPNDAVFGAGWNRFIAFAQEKGIRISIGIICDSLDQDAPEYFEKIRQLNDAALVEFWNHGYHHRRDRETGFSEFRGPDYETQLETLLISQALAREKLGFPFHSFGAPFNAVDQNTVKALRQIPELNSWLYGINDAALLPGQVVLDRSVRVEQPVHYPNYEVFTADFLKDSNRPYYVLQVHPGGWDEERLEVFGEIVAFLLQRDAEFITPSELRTRLLTKE